MQDSELILAIQELLDGVEWTPDTLSEIATLLRENGYRVQDLQVSDSCPEYTHLAPVTLVQLAKEGRLFQEPEDSPCPECSRSFGPHYRGTCNH